MKTLGRALIQRLREIAYLLISLPISITLFALALIGLSAQGFIPIAILVFLTFLTVMEYVARFEIRRANLVLGTDFRVVEKWFGKPFFTWEGAKERVTSLRAWLAVAYVFIAFGWSIFSFVLVVLGVAGFGVVIASLGIYTLANFSRSFEVIDNGDVFRGSIDYDKASGRLQLKLGDPTNSGIINWDLFSNWFLALGIILIGAALWIIPRNARAIAQMVEGLLSGGYLPMAEAQLAKLRSRRNVSERDIREAMDREALQPQLSELSSREREILALMAQGKSNSGIAKSLYITEGAVEKHISNILSKLGLNAQEENHRRVLAVLKYLGIDPKDEKVQ